MITIEVAYSGVSGAQAIITVPLKSDSTVAEGILASKILEFESFPEFSKDFDVSKLSDRLSIFGKLTTLDTVLKNGDRIEILRPLLKNPMQARRDRARKFPLKKKK